jgi:hypothetical protein
MKRLKSAYGPVIMSLQMKTTAIAAVIALSSASLALAGQFKGDALEAGMGVPDHTEAVIDGSEGKMSSAGEFKIVIPFDGPAPAGIRYEICLKRGFLPEVWIVDQDVLEYDEEFKAEGGEGTVPDGNYQAPRLIVRTNLLDSGGYELNNCLGGIQWVSTATIEAP